MNRVCSARFALLLAISWMTGAGGTMFAQTLVPAEALPPLPPARSPVDAFRELLALPPEAQRAALSNRTEAARQRLVVKLREYRQMDPDTRELRLLATELRWYLPSLLALAPADRASRLAELRPDLRALIEPRLTGWDGLPAELRSQVLANEATLGWLLQLQPGSDRMREKLVTEVPAELRDTLTRALARLDAMPPADRARAFGVFEHVFTMTAAEKQRALRVMSAAEKSEMEKSLAAFVQLPPEQRKACIRAYEKFANMSPPERALFYRNVQVWEKMTATERQQWRELVKNVELLPPVSDPRIKLPPLPPEPAPRVTTNRT
jgi:hypothetical protein